MRSSNLGWVILVASCVLAAPARAAEPKFVVELGPATNFDAFLGHPPVFADVAVAFGPIQIGAAGKLFGGLVGRGGLVHLGYRWNGYFGDDSGMARPYYALWAGAAVSSLCLGYGDVCGGVGLAGGGELGLALPMRGTGGELGLALKSTSVLAMPMSVPFVAGLSVSYRR